MTPDSLAERVTAAVLEFGARVDARRRRLIGIVGAPGAGKTTVTAQVVAAWPRPDDVAVLAMDGYHLSQARLVQLGRRDRMGAPDTFDVDAFAADLEKARDIDVSMLVPGFDRTREEVVPSALTIPKDARFVLVEGNYLLHDADGWERIRPLVDGVVYLQPDEAERRARLVARHIEFGKTPEEAEEWVARSDEANAALIAATAHRADRILVIPPATAR